MTLQPRPCDNPKLVFCTAPAPTFFWRSTLHKDGSGRARSGTREAVHPSLVSIRTHLPDAHVTRWPSGRARSRPPTAPLIGKDGAAEGRGSLPFANALRDRPRIFMGARSIVSCVRPSKRGVHPATTARTRGILNIRAGCRKDRAFSIRKRLSTAPPIRT